jgi:hypothetical protein
VAQNSAFIRGWPTAALLLGLVLTVTWIGLLGYGAVALTELAFGYSAPVAKAPSGLAVGTTAADSRHIIQATNIMDGSQAIIIPCKSPLMTTIVGIPKSMARRTICSNRASTFRRS